MTYANYQDKLAAMRRYSQTPEGRAAKKRSHQRYIEKRRSMRIQQLTVNPAPLAQALKEWTQ